MEDRIPSDSPSDTPQGSSDPSGGVGGARYKLVAPAKLPISRSPCLTIPSGLSPTSFLESPVLLSDIKVDPSPTTGSLSKYLSSRASFAGFSFPGSTTRSDTFDENKSSCFEFRPLPSNMAPADPQFRSEQYMQTHVQSALVKSERASSSNELSLSAPVPLATSGSNALAEVDFDEPSQTGHPQTGMQVTQGDHRVSGPSVSSDDGYNWRKYGQKHVKGSEFPRSYYKCTHPNCEVKKLFERSHDGQITEIIYKGTHDHPKPQPNRRYSGGNMMSSQEERSDRFSSQNGRDDKPSNMYGQMPHATEPNGNPELSPANDDNVDEVDEEDPFSKRRKVDGGLEITPVVKPIREPRVVVQTLSEVDILDDGYRWRKYGQKVVRGNPNPRSYYKCTAVGCPVRKHVERASHDPKAVITTYEGKHNHDVPTARTTSHDTAGPSAMSGPPRIRAEESDSISLDLGVGMGSTPESSSNEHQHQQLVQNQSQNGNSSFRFAQSNPMAAYYGVLNGGMNQYGSRENRNEGHGVELPPLNLSAYAYPQNMGRILTGP